MLYLNETEMTRKKGEEAVKTLAKVKKWAGVIVIVVVLLVGVVSGYRFAAQKAEKEQAAKIAEAVEAALAEAKEDEFFVADEITKEIDMKIVLKNIQAIGELATVEYLYTDAGKFSDPKQIFGYNIPLITKSFVVKWDGIIKGGIKDVSAITVEADGDTKTVTVSLPKAEMLSHTVDDESLETLDENNNVFNRITVDDVNIFLAESKKATEQRALDNGMLEKAQKNAEILILNLLNANETISQNYDVKFVEK